MTTEAETGRCGSQPRDTWGPSSWARTQPPPPQPSLPRMTPPLGSAASLHSAVFLPVGPCHGAPCQGGGSVLSWSWDWGVLGLAAWAHSPCGLGTLRLAQSLSVPISGCDLVPRSRAQERGPAAQPGPPGGPTAPRPEHLHLTWGDGTLAAWGLEGAVPGTGWASKRTRASPHPGDSPAGPEATPSESPVSQGCVGKAGAPVLHSLGGLWNLPSRVTFVRREAPPTEFGVWTSKPRPSLGSRSL